MFLMSQKTPVSLSVGLCSQSLDKGQVCSHRMGQSAKARPPRRLPVSLGMADWIRSQSLAVTWGTWPPTTLMVIGELGLCPSPWNIPPLGLLRLN